MGTILLLEDEESVNRGIAFTLEKEKHTVFPCATIEGATAIYEKNMIHLAICDLSLPDGSGLEFVRKIRSNRNLHIICLTALDQEVEQVMGYEAGADDYITKPFSLSVLALKVNAYFRRLEGREQNQMESGGIHICGKQMRVYVQEEEVSLTKNEWKLLQCFLSHPKQVMTKNQLIEQLFDVDGEFVEENTIAVNIRRLREKIEPEPSTPQYIKNIRGIGYIWDMECKKC